MKAWTYLRRFQRQNTPDQSLIAEQQDVTDAFRIYDELAESNELGLTPSIYNFYTKILKPLGEGPFDRSTIQRQYREVYHKPLSHNKLQRAILPSLEAAGLIRLEPDPLDRRKQLVYVELIESHPVGIHTSLPPTPPDSTISSIDTPTRDVCGRCLSKYYPGETEGHLYKRLGIVSEGLCAICNEPAQVKIEILPVQTNQLQTFAEAHVWGGKREGSGHPQRKPSKWPRGTDLASAMGVDRFLRKLIEETWKNNVLDARVLSALNGTMKLLLENRHWIGSDSRYESWDDPVEGGNEKESENENPKESEDISNLTPEERLKKLQEWKKELEDAGVPPIKIDLPDINQLADNIKALPPEDKVHFIEICRQRGISKQALERFGLTEDGGE